MLRRPPAATHETLIERLLPMVLLPFVGMHLVQVGFILASDELIPLGGRRLVAAAILVAGFAACIAIHLIRRTISLEIAVIGVVTTLAFMLVALPSLPVAAWQSHGVWLGIVCADCLIAVAMLVRLPAVVVVTAGLVVTYTACVAAIDGWGTVGTTSFFLTATNMVGITVVCFGLAVMARVDTARRLEAERALAAAEERNRLHRMIHDSALQPLDALAGGWDVDLDALRATARQQSALLRAAIRGEHAVEDLVMSERLQALADAWRGRGFRVDLDLRADDALVTPTRAAALIGAIGEALANVAKHARVRSVRIASAVRSDRLYVEVSDRGQGFDPSAASHGLGIAHSIRSRLDEVEGGTEVASRPGTGTTVTMWVPLEG